MNQLNLRLSKKSGSTTVGFRLDDEAAELLAARANTLGVSIHELARHYVNLALETESLANETAQALVAIFEEIKEARKDIALSTRALLVSAGKAPEEQALAWVKENFQKDEG